MLKKYIWCFAGQIHSQGDRKKMIESLKKCDGEYYLHINESWQSVDSLSAEEYKKILKQSIFVPCPRGNTSVDTFRLYEALEVGAIPIVEKSDYWRNLLGEHPLIETASWNNIYNDINLLLEDPQWIIDHSKKVQSWWVEYKKQLKQNIEKIIAAKSETTRCKQKQNNIPINVDLKTKQQQLIKLTKDWQNFVNYDFFDYICKNIKSKEMPNEPFSVYNPNKDIGVVILYTKEIAEYAVYCEESVKDYCFKQGYTLYVYRETLDKNASPNWSKAKAILNHFNDHKDIVWMDSDTLVFNPDRRFEDILAKCTRTKKIIACEDIGSNNKNIPKGSMLNSGVLIFRNHPYAKNIIKRWLEFQGDKSSLYSSGGDQEILCDILKKSDGFGFNRKVFPMNEFNTEPRFVNEDTFIVHFMAYPYNLKKFFMSYFIES